MVYKLNESLFDDLPNPVFKDRYNDGLEWYRIDYEYSPEYGKSYDRETWVRAKNIKDAEQKFFEKHNDDCYISEIMDKETALGIDYEMESIDNDPILTTRNQELKEVEGDNNNMVIKESYDDSLYVDIDELIGTLGRALDEGMDHNPDVFAEVADVYGRLVEMRDAGYQLNTVQSESLSEDLKVNNTYDRYCDDCDCITSQEYKGRKNYNGRYTPEDMFLCTDCGCENYFKVEDGDESLKESRLTEGPTDKDYMSYSEVISSLKEWADDDDELELTAEYVIFDNAGDPYRGGSLFRDADPSEVINYLHSNAKELQQATCYYIEGYGAYYIETETKTIGISDDPRALHLSQ